MKFRSENGTASSGLLKLAIMLLERAIAVFQGKGEIIE